jgi:hypothetical protein
MLGKTVTDRPKRVLEVVHSDLTAEDDAGDAGEVLVQSGPEPRVDDFVAEVIRHLEVPQRVHVSGRSGGVEPVNINVDLVGTEKGAEYLGHRRRDIAVCGGVFRVVRRGQRRPPACLRDSSRVTVVITRHGTEAVVCDCRRINRSIDRGNRPAVIFANDCRLVAYNE